LVVRIEANTPTEAAVAALETNALFGLWKDRSELADVAEFINDLREPRYSPAGARRKPA
jgi:hypothetical protein